MRLTELFLTEDYNRSEISHDMECYMRPWVRDNVDPGSEWEDIADINVHDFLRSRPGKLFLSFWKKEFSTMKPHHKQKIFNKAWNTMIDEFEGRDY